GAARRSRSGTGSALTDCKRRAVLRRDRERVLCGPTAVRHHHRSRLYPVGLAVLRIHYGDCFRVPRFALVLYASGGRAEPDPHRVPGLLQLWKIDPAPVYALDGIRAENRVRNQGLHHMAANAVVPPRKSERVLARAGV